MCSVAGLRAQDCVHAVVGLLESRELPRMLGGRERVGGPSLEALSDVGPAQLEDFPKSRRGSDAHRLWNFPAEFGLRVCMLALDVRTGVPEIPKFFS